MHMHCVFYRHPLHLTKTINFLMEVEKLPSNLKNDLELLLKKGGDQECRTVSSVPRKTAGTCAEKSVCCFTEGLASLGLVCKCLL